MASTAISELRQKTSSTAREGNLLTAPVLLHYDLNLDTSGQSIKVVYYVKTVCDLPDFLCICPLERTTSSHVNGLEENKTPLGPTLLHLRVQNDTAGEASLIRMSVPVRPSRFNRLLVRIMVDVTILVPH